MTIQSSASLNDIYVLKTGLSHQQLSSSINRCLCQAEALSVVAALIDAEAVGLDTINNYLWTLSDIIQEARWLYGHLIDKR